MRLFERDRREKAFGEAVLFQLGSSAVGNGVAAFTWIRKVVNREVSGWDAGM